MAATIGFLSGHATQVAPRLLGSHITSRVDDGEVTIRLTEVEAYGGVGEDPGSHAFRRQTARNAAMFGPPGHVYVYFTYGMHWCVNIVTGEPGTAGAVLLRAGEVVEGIDVARLRRPNSSDRDLARGPARLARALGMSGVWNGLSLEGPEVRLSPSAVAEEFESGPRTGVAGAGARAPWRFWLPGDPTVSPYRSARMRG